MTKEEILEALSALRSKTEVDSITPADVAAVVGMVADYAESTKEIAENIGISDIGFAGRDNDELILKLSSPSGVIEREIPIARMDKCGLMSTLDKQNLNLLDLNFSNLANTVADNTTAIEGLKRSVAFNLETTVTAIDDASSAADKSISNLKLNIINSFGVSYDSKSGKYSLNGLEDLTESQVWRIISIGKHPFIDGVFRSCGGRTNLPPMNGTTMLAAKSLNAMFVDAYALEVVSLGGFGLVAEELIRCFTRCEKLKRIGLTQSEYISSKKFILYGADVVSETFSGLPSLEYVYIKDLKSDIQFKDSPELKAECVEYMVDNAANEGATINIYLHPTALANLPNSIVLKAVSKNINLASLSN